MNQHSFISVSQKFVKSKIQRFPRNQSNCRVAQHASLLTYSASSEISSLYPGKLLGRATINRWFKKLGGGFSDALSKVLQSWWKSSIKTLIARQDSSRTTVMRRFTELGHANKWSTWIPQNLSPNPQKFCLVGSTTAYLSIKL